MTSIINFSLTFSLISFAIILGIIGNKENISKTSLKLLKYTCFYSLVICLFSLILEFTYFF